MFEGWLLAVPLRRAAASGAWAFTALGACSLLAYLAGRVSAEFAAAGKGHSGTRAFVLQLLEPVPSRLARLLLCPRATHGNAAEG